MKGRLSLDDAVLFLAVADCGSLAGAAKATGSSVPTLSRRMTALERQMNARLFQRGKEGYALTAAGRAVQRDVADLRDISRRLSLMAKGGHVVPVRVTAGEWTSQFLSRNIRDWWSPAEDWKPEFLPCNSDIDIARRAADVGVRNRRPSQSWLAGRRTAHIRYAVFSTCGAADGFVTLPEDADMPPSARWIHKGRDRPIAMTASSPRIVLDLALRGTGHIVLPLFAAAEHPALIQRGRPIDELAHEEWLVCHQDTRNDAGIRPALDALAALLSDPDHRAL